MRVILIHAREFMYRVREKALESADEIDGELIRPEHRAENAIVAFVTVEEGDSKSDSLIELSSSDIVDLASKLNANVIVIYPYAHLSANLAPPSEAKHVLEKLYYGVKGKTNNIEIVRAPFGWYKEFLIHCYGHPLSELSREYRVKEKQVEIPSSAEREYFVVEPSGKVYKPEEYLERADEDLRVVIEKEALGKEIGEVETAISKLCSKFGFEWEPFSDYGHMRYEPHATYIIEAVSDYAWRVARSLPFPILKVRGTNMFDLAQPAVYEHARLFGDRLYSLIADKKKLVLRYAACHQQFAMLRNYVLSYRDLPLGMFEVADS